MPRSTIKKRTLTLAAVIVAANCAILFLTDFSPRLYAVPHFFPFLHVLSILGVFPLDFILFLKSHGDGIHYFWMFLVIVCAIGIYQLNNVARLVFVTLNILNICAILFVVIREHGNALMLEYAFVMYFNIVAASVYVGFLTFPGIRGHFKNSFQSAKWGILGKRITIRKLTRNDAASYYNLGLTYTELKRYKDAIKSLREAIHLNPEFVNAHYELGKIYEAQKMYNEAFACFKKAVAIKPNHSMGLYHLGLMYVHQGCDNEAMSSLKYAIRLNPSYGEIHRALGLVYISLERYHDAIRSLKQALRLGAEDSSIYFHMGVIFTAQLEKYKDAINAFKKAIRLDPSFADAHYNLGMTYIKLQRHKDAIRALKDAVRFDDYNARAHYDLGVTYALIGDFGSARREMHKLEELDSDLANTLAILIRS